jgi:hypothetical protein
MQKVYLFRVMPVCVELIMLAAYFCHSCLVQVEYNANLHKRREIHFLRNKILGEPKKFEKTGNLHYLGLELTMHVLKSQINLVRQSL